MVNILFWTPKSIKNTFQATKFKAEENLSTFQGLAQKFKDFSRKNGIHGLFKDFPLTSRTFQDSANSAVLELLRQLYLSLSCV